MHPLDRKAAVAAYKERKSATGFYVLRCIPTAEAWVGQAPNMDAIRNRLWFTLRHGGCTSRSAQAAWDRHGEASFSFEELERLAEDDPDLGVKAALTRRCAAWRDRVGAQAL